MLRNQNVPLQRRLWGYTVASHIWQYLLLHALNGPTPVDSDVQLYDKYEARVPNLAGRCHRVWVVSADSRDLALRTASS